MTTPWTPRRSTAFFFLLLGFSWCGLPTMVSSSSEEEEATTSLPRLLLQHPRKLHLAPQHLAIPQQYMVVFQFDTASHDESRLQRKLAALLPRQVLLPSHDDPAQFDRDHGGYRDDNPEDQETFGGGRHLRPRWAHRLRLLHVYRQTWQGFSATGVSPTLLEHWLNDPEVAYIEQDAVVTLDPWTSHEPEEEDEDPSRRGRHLVVEPTSIHRQTATSTTSTMIDQTNPPSWGLDRIDQAVMPLNNLYQYDNSSGTGVRVYVLDSGIRVTHQDFLNKSKQPRAFCGINYISKESCTTDYSGHGTSVAGIVGGSIYGVAKNVTLYAVKVVTASGSSSVSYLTAGINWVITQKQNNPTIPMIISMSLSTPNSTTLNDAANRAVAMNVAVVVSAGNSNLDACNYSPTAVARILVVGATNRSDMRTSWSNYGKCVDLYAPGDKIVSAGATSDNSTTTFSGTSFAQPHVAGVVALLWSRNPTAAAADIQAQALALARSGQVGGSLGGGPNLLLQSRSTAESKDVQQTPAPSRRPSQKPSRRPSSRPSRHPSKKPSRRPSSRPSRHPSKKPSRRPSSRPSRHPSKRPSHRPTFVHTVYQSVPPTTLRAVPCFWKQQPCLPAVYGPAAYWVHVLLPQEPGTCHLVCVPTHQVPTYLDQGYQCGRCK